MLLTARSDVLLPATTSLPTTPMFLDGSALGWFWQPGVFHSLQMLWLNASIIQYCISQCLFEVGPIIHCDEIDCSVI